MHAKTCGTQIALEHNGDVYSCDHFVEPEYLLGNIAPGGRTLLELVTLPEQRQFGQDKRDTLPRYCRECDVRFACNGGCPKDRFVASPLGEPGHNYLCPSYKLFFGHIDQPMREMAEHLAHHQPPALIMNAYAAEDAKRGRNDPCTCANGRKWKHCHGGD